MGPEQTTELSWWYCKIPSRLGTDVPSGIKPKGATFKVLLSFLRAVLPSTAPERVLCGIPEERQ